MNSKEYWRRYYEQNKEKLLKKNREWAKNNKEKIREHQKKWIEENKEKYNLTRKRYNEKHRERINKQARIRQMKKRIELLQTKIKKLEKELEEK